MTSQIIVLLKIIDLILVLALTFHKLNCRNIILIAGKITIKKRGA
jgi:hypothetical protein